MKSSLRILRIAGIDIGIHYSWLFIFVLLAVTLALGYFPQYTPNKTQASYWAAGIIVTLILFISVLIHELAHSLVAKSRGMPVHSITLFILGGVSNLEEEPKKANIEFVMAVAGPATSLVLAVVFWFLFLAVQPHITASDIIRFGGWLPQSSLIGASLLYLALINVALAAFNILPGFPLDGGRVFRSIIWGATGNLTRATDIAAMVGRFLGWAFIAVGVLNILGYRILIFGPGIVSGIWIGLIGWFLSSAASSSRREVTMRESLSGVKVKDAMLQVQETISPNTTVSELVHGVFSQRYHRAVPVCDAGRTVGIVTISDVKGISQDKWPATTVQQIMTKKPLYTVGPEDDLNQAMKLLGQHDLNQLLVMDGERCAGLLSRAEIFRYIQLTQELRIRKGA